MELLRFARLCVFACSVLLLLVGATRPAHAQVDFANLGLKQGHLFRLKVDTTPGRPLDVIIPIDGLDRAIKLNPHSVRGKDFKLYESKQLGELIEVDPGPENTLRGQVIKDPASIVAGGVMPDGLYLLIQLGDGRRFWVEPAAARVPGLPADQHVIYSHEDILENKGVCGVDDAKGEAVPQSFAPRGLTRYVAEVAVETDFEFYNRYGSVSLVNSRIFLVYNIVNVQYERDVDIQHAVVNVIVNTGTTTSDPYNQNTAQALADEMRNYWNFLRFGIPRDVAHLFTGKPTGGVIGYAYYNAICGSLTNGFGYGVSQVDYNNANLASACDLVAHEHGHNWNACHCPCSSPAFTMNPSITGINRFGFVADECSTNSINAIIAHRNSRTCLTTSFPGVDPPLNDACPGYPIGPGTWGFGNVGAIADGPSSCATTGSDIWYSYVAPYDTTIVVSTCGTHDMPGVDAGLDSVLTVYSGSCGSLTQVACNDDNTSQCADAGVRRDSYLTFTATRGTQYLIRLSGFSGSQGTGFINFFDVGSCGAPANDNCAAATTVSNGTFPFSTFCATTDGTIDSDCDFFGYTQVGSDVWFNYTAQCAGTVTVSTCGSSFFDTKIAVYVGTDCAYTSPGNANLALVCNDDSCGNQSSVSFNAIGGTSYKIRVGGYNGAQGTGLLTVSNAACPIQANDACTNATNVSAGGLWTGNLIGATNDNAVAVCGNATANRDVWYAYTACAPGNVTFSTCGTNDAPGVDSGMDTVLSVFDACGGTLVDCSDDASGACPGLDSGIARDSSITLAVNAGDSFRVRLSHFDMSQPGAFTFRTTFVPANDDCIFASPAFVGVNSFCTYGATNSGLTEACFSGGEAYKDVWLVYSSAVTAQTTLTTCDPLTNFDTVLAVYAGGCPILSDTAIACADDDASCANIRATTLTFPADAGVDYYIRIGGFNSVTPNGVGNLVISVNCVADVDDGSGTGTRDGGVGIEDLLYYLALFEEGSTGADVDDGTGTGTPDGGVGIEDLLYYLARFEAGC